jgi:uncharacterized membrane protein YfcA
MLFVRLASAGLDVSLPGLVGAGLVIGFLIGLFGVGGGFLLIPVLKSLFGVPYPVAVGSGLTQIFINACISSWKHWRHGNLDLKLGLLLAAGALTGTEAGVRLLGLLGSLKTVVLLGRSFALMDLTLHLLFLLLLTLVAVFVLVETASSRRPAAGSAAAPGMTTVPGMTVEGSPSAAPTGIARRLQGVALRPVLAFPASGLAGLSIWLPLAFSVLVGVVTGMAGVGGGFITFPLLVYLIGVPTLTAVGTSSFQVLCASGYGAFRHCLQQHVDPLLVLLLLAGSLAGVQLGVMASRRLEAQRLRRYFALVVISGAGVIVYDLIKQIWF